MSLHILPINDIKEHIKKSTCLCHPKLIVENGEMLFIHNSFDGREKLEEIVQSKVEELLKEARIEFGLDKNEDKETK